MGTEFTEIYDLFTVLCSDYKFNELYLISPDDLSMYLQPYLRFAVDEFKRVCDQKIQENMDIQNGTFTIELKEYNKIPLARIMIKYWFQHLVNDVLQIQAKLNDTDFKHYAEANNLNAKQSTYQQMREECSQILTDYSIEYKINWRDWANGVY